MKINLRRTNIDYKRFKKIYFCLHEKLKNLFLDFIVKNKYFFKFF